MMDSSFPISPFCSQKTQLSLHMTPSMQQLLRVLEMPFLELASWIDEQIEQNPLLEKKEESTLYSFISHETPFIPEKAEDPSFFSYLMEQAREVFSDPFFIQIAEWIIGNLDEKGFYTLPLSSLPPEFTSKDFLFCLEKIQQFDPPGVGAKDIQESLLLQLQRKGKEHSLCYRLVKEHFFDLLQQRHSFLEKKFGLTKKTMQELLTSDLSRLHPYPCIHLQKDFFGTAPDRVVDVEIKEAGNSWKIRVKNLPLPKDSSYAQLEGSSPEELVFFSSYRKEAKWLRDAIAKRQKTLHRVSSYLVQQQKNYLNGTSASLQELSLQEAADFLSLHKSTILRAVSGKYISTPIGILPLKNLFSHSCDQAHKLLQQLIVKEDKRSPLSDRELLEKMKEQGIACSRRTLTKYRQTLQIPSSHARKSG